MKITPLDVQRMVFKLKLRGYDRREVDRFLEEVAQTLDDLGRENLRLGEDYAKLEAQVADLKRSETALSRTLISTQTIADGLKQAAERDADLVRKEAELKAAELLRDAREELLRTQRDLIEFRKQRRLAIEKMRATLKTFDRMLEIEEAEDREDGAGQSSRESVPSVER